MLLLSNKLYFIIVLSTSLISLLSFSPQVHINISHLNSFWSSDHFMRIRENKELERGIFEINSPPQIKSDYYIQSSNNKQLSEDEIHVEFSEHESGYYENRVHELEDGHKLVFDEYFVADNTHDLIVCLNNLCDGKKNGKSESVLRYCSRHRRNFLCFDWLGRGKSTGKLKEATISRWAADTIHFLDNQADHVTGGIAGVKAVLVGVGVGGWVAVLVALQRPDLVRGIVGLSADPDFTEDLLWNHLKEEEKNVIMKKGFCEIRWGGRDEVYPITSSLIEDGRKNLVLRGGKDSLEIICPVRLIHSLADEEVPYSTALRLAFAIVSKNIKIVMPKIGGHDLQEDYKPPGHGWVDPEDNSSIPLKSKLTIKSALEDCLDQILLSTIPSNLKDITI